MCAAKQIEGCYADMVVQSCFIRISGEDDDMEIKAKL